MLTYTFSKREKAMLVALALVLVAVVWYQLIFVGTQDQMSKIESDIAAVQDEMVLDAAKAQQLQQMRAAIEQYKASGVRPKPMPAYDNIEPLMAELNATLAQAGEYSLTFDDVDLSDGSVAKRGVTMAYSADSYESARSIALGLVGGSYPCAIDEMTITNNASARQSSSRIVATSGAASAAFTATLHLTFYEEVTGPVAGGQAQAQDGSTAGSNAVAVGEALGMVNAPSGAGTKVLTGAAGSTAGN